MSSTVTARQSIKNQTPLQPVPERARRDKSIGGGPTNKQSSKMMIIQESAKGSLKGSISRDNTLVKGREMSHSLSKSSRHQSIDNSKKGLNDKRSKSKHGESNISQSQLEDGDLDGQTIGESPSKVNAVTPSKAGRTTLPSIMSNRKDPAEIYKQNFQLNMDTLILNQRQNQITLNNYYRKLVRQRMPLTNNITPQSFMELQQLGFASFSQAFNPQSQDLKTILNQGFQKSPLPMLKPDDSLFVDLTPTIKKEKDILGEGSFNFVNNSKSTMPNTSRAGGPSISYIEQSITEQIAGNAQLSKLNANLHQYALDKIEKNIDQAHVKRSRQRRKRELGVERVKSGDEEVPYNQRGSMDPRSDNISETETVANSSVYNMLRDDMSGFESFMKKGEAEEFNRNRSAIELDGSEFNKTGFSDQEMTKDPELHFQKLRAKIKLKATKMYQEDIKLKKEAEKQAPVIEVKDKFGRVVERIVDGKKMPVTKNSVPKPRQKPKKIPPLVRKMSFTECQLKYADKLNLVSPLLNMKAPTLTDLLTIKKMQASDRWPIPEKLINRPSKGNFSMMIDSLMHAAYNEEEIVWWSRYRQEVDAPFNSMESENEYPIYESNDSDDEIDRVPKPTKFQKKNDENFKEKQFDKSLIELTNFRMENMRSFPHRVREGEVPFKLGKLKHAQGFIDVQDRLSNQQKGALWSIKLLQNVFEHFCVEMKASPVPIGNYIVLGDNKIKKITLRNFNLDEATGKALACIIPFIIDIEEMEFSNNQLTDHIGAALVLSFFQNPSLHKMTITYNFLRGSFVRTLCEMIKIQPDKISSLNLMGSIASSDHLEHLFKNLESFKQLITINFSGNNFSVNTCRILGLFITNSYSLRDIDIAHCRISYQGTRSIIDALNRNTMIRSFNFAFNDLTSSAYEFSIKIASIITRHPSLMHLDISKTNLKREEVLFIGLSISTSKTILSIHLTANELPYYERIFLRSTIAARCGFEFRNLAGRKEVKSNKERNQILQMASGEVYDPLMNVYVTNLKDLDCKREGLDYEISDMLQEMDTVASFADIPENSKIEDIPLNTKIGMLVNKVVERNAEIERTKLAVQEIYSIEGPKIRTALEKLAGIEEISLYNFDKFGNLKPDSREKNGEEDQDFFERQKALKVQRQRAKAERIATKEARDRSAGELALMFMGINQIAYELLVENPMTGYMNEIIFSRVLGYDDIEQGTWWQDTTQCWICQKWNKVEIKYHLFDDSSIFAQKVTQIDNMHLMINRCIVDGTKRAIQQLHKEHLQSLPEPDNLELVQHRDDDSFILEVEEEFEGTTKMSGGLKTGDLKMTGLKTFRKTSKMEKDNKGITIAGKSSKITSIAGSITISESEKKDIAIEDQSHKSSGLSHIAESVADTEIIPITNPMNGLIDQTNQISPVKATVDSVKKTIFPAQFTTVNEFEDLKLRNSFDYNNMPKPGQDQPIQPKGFQNRTRIQQVSGKVNTHSTDDVTALRNHFVGSRSNTLSEGEMTHQASVISVTEHKRRARGEPMLVQKLIFFEGIVYQIEEEVYSDSDHSSVYTSEDDFEQDREIGKKYKRNNPLLSEVDLTDPLVSEATKQKILSKLQSKEALESRNNTLIRRNSAASAKQTSLNEPGIDETEPIELALKSEKSQVSKKDSTIKVTAPAKQGSLKVNPTKGKEQASVTPTSAPNTNKKQKIVEENKNPTDLTQNQKDYESRIMPKHYQPELMKFRMKRFDEIDSQPSQSQARLQKPAPKGPIRRDSIGSMQAKDRTTNTDGFKPFEKEIYVVASFNDWQPNRMKTSRTLNLEKYPLFDEEAVPKNIFMLDNTIVLYCNMVPPGTHYFYFVRDRGSIFLSPKYDVVRFKNTNIFLNRIIVKRRIKDLDTVHIARDADDDEAVFMKDRSVFRDFIENTPARLRKAFDEDMQFSKIHKTCKSDPVEMQKITDCLLSHYEKIMDVYHYYIGISSYPTIAMNEFTSFAQKCQFMDNKNINLAALDRILITTNVAIHNYTSSAERDLQRYEFLEIIVRMANAKYKETHQANTTVQAIEKILHENVFAYAKSVGGEAFRKYHCYNVKTNELLKKNEAQLKKVYDSFTHAKKRWVTMEECQRYVRNMDLDVSEMMCGPIYAESLCLIIDTIRDQTRPNQMKYVEFLVFICRIAKEHYDDSPYEKEASYLKLDHLLPRFLRECQLDPVFRFGEKFEYDKEEEIKRKRRNKRRIMKAKKKAEQLGQKFDMTKVEGLVSPPTGDLQDGEKSQLGSDNRSNIPKRDGGVEISSGEEVDLGDTTDEEIAPYKPKPIKSNIEDFEKGSHGTVSSVPTAIRDEIPDNELKTGEGHIRDLHDAPNLNKDLNAELKPEERKMMSETQEERIIGGLMKAKIKEKLTEPPKDGKVLVPVDLERLNLQQPIHFSEVLKDYKILQSARQSGQNFETQNKKAEKILKAITNAGLEEEDDDLDREDIN